MKSRLAFLGICILVICVLCACKKKEQIEGYYYMDLDGKKTSRTFEYKKEDPQPFDENGIAEVVIPSNAYCADNDNTEWEVYFIDKNFNVIGDRRFVQSMVMKAVNKGNDIFIAGTPNGIEILDENMTMISSISYDMKGVNELHYIISKPGENGLFPIKDQATDMWGYMTIKGEIVIDAKYEYARPFSKDGVAVVQSNNGKYGTINENGEFVIEPVYNDLSDFNEGRAFAEINDDDRANLIDLEGNIISENEFETVVNGPFCDGVACVKDYNTHLSGYVDINGDYVINPSFDFAYDFINGYALVNSKDSQLGLINRRGEEILPCQYSYLGNVSEDGILPIKDTQNGLVGYYSLKDKDWIIEPKYKAGGSFSNGLAIVME